MTFTFKKCLVQEHILIYLDTIINCDRAYNLTAYNTSLKGLLSFNHCCLLTISLKDPTSCRVRSTSNVAGHPSWKLTVQKFLVYFFTQVSFCEVSSCSLVAFISSVYFLNILHVLSISVSIMLASSDIFLQLSPLFSCILLCYLCFFSNLFNDIYLINFTSF